ncbi:hypothetical protein ABB30_10245 [Stenotrophomonas ginsengisoli]|uniref:DUF4189 domain-containing protein n=1 Tax=Stenotrophomonas ginsengisoli TaxID=336566 RepID=A0A0R0DD32_9GAMM|nr:hypothetical protein ABB30_10245 [Stenotrophomonas ginsengisoli]
MLLFTLLGGVTQPSMAQTACPVGTLVGSATCGPDAAPVDQVPSRPTSYVRYDGYGAIAYSPVSHVSFLNGASNGMGQEAVIEQAMTRCRAEYGGDCVILHTWENACANTGSVIVNGQKQVFAVEARSERATARKVREECSRRNPNWDYCKVGAQPVCAKGWGGYVSH